MDTNKRTRQKVVKVFSCFNEGTVGVQSEIEISITPGIPTFEVIGLCGSVIRESRGRIYAAMISSGYEVPKGHIVVSISPAYLHKSGSSFDLPIAIGLLMASGQLPEFAGKRIYAQGELSLTGFINGTPGAAARLMSMSNNKSDYDMVIIPSGEANAASIANLEGYPLENLRQIKDLCDGLIPRQKFDAQIIEDDEADDLDFSCVKGQEKAMRALVIAACGYHSILLLGSPGCGKTTAGNVIRGLLPPLTYDEMAELYTIKEAAGISKDDGSSLCLSSVRPLRRIYPGMTPSRILGSARNMSPGELVLADHGIVLADEICDFPNYLLDCLRLPLEEHMVRMQKDGRDFNMPARFLFVGAGNPCRCGMYYENGSKCNCSPLVRKKYINKIAGPFADRIDLFAEMRSISSKDMYNITNSGKENLSSVYREMVARVWDVQKERYKDLKGARFNGLLDGSNMDLIRASSEVVKYAADLAEKSGFSARGYTKLLRVGRTIADMNEEKDVTCSVVAEAAAYRYR